MRPSHIATMLLMVSLLGLFALVCAYAYPSVAIVGGVVLIILGIVGVITFQHIRTDNRIEWD